MANAKAQAAGIKIVPTDDPPYRPSDSRERRDMIKNFLKNPKMVDIVMEKLFKVMVADGAQGFTNDEARRFAIDFLLPEIDKDRDEEVKGNRQLKKRPAGINIDRDEQFWKNEIDESMKQANLKPNKNTRDQLKTYMVNVLGRVQTVSDSALTESKNKALRGADAL